MDNASGTDMYPPPHMTMRCYALALTCILLLIWRCFVMDNASGTDVYPPPHMRRMLCFGQRQWQGQRGRRSRRVFVGGGAGARAPAALLWLGQMVKVCHARAGFFPRFFFLGCCAWDKGSKYAMVEQAICFFCDREKWSKYATCSSRLFVFVLFFDDWDKCSKRRARVLQTPCSCAPNGVLVCSKRRARVLQTACSCARAGFACPLVWGACAYALPGSCVANVLLMCC